MWTYNSRILTHYRFDWNYTTIAQTGLNNRTIPYPRGFVLGGSSSISLSCVQPLLEF
jgi:choline dehydrogenase-like flavoprotein